MPADEVPEPGLADGGAVRDVHRVVRVVGAVAEPVDAEVPGRPARHHAGPGRDRDRRHDRRQLAVRAPLHQARERGELVPPTVEDERRLGAIEPDNHDASHYSPIPTSSSHEPACTGTQPAAPQLAPTQC